MRKSLSVQGSGELIRAEGSEELIRADGLVKPFGSTRALDGLDLLVQRGQVHGFLGPNGAGKSTTIRAILGQLRLDAGSLHIFGLHPLRDAVRIHDRLAYVPGDTVLWPTLTGGECIDLLGRFGGHQNRQRRDELVQRFELDPTKRAATYSKGNRQKVVLIAALSADVELLLLDEPTTGLDPVMEAEFQRAIRQAAADGRTVLLSSHILDEVEALCDRVTIIRGGRTVSTGTLQSLRAASTTTVQLVGDRVVPEALAGVLEHRTEPCGSQLRTTLVVAAESVAQVVATVAALDPDSLVVRPASLDEVFLQHYRTGSAAPASPARPLATGAPGRRR